MDTGMPIIALVGTKADLPRKISQHEAAAFASRLGWIYFETCATSGLNVDNTISTLGSLGVKRFYPEKLQKLTKQTEQQVPMESSNKDSGIVTWLSTMKKKIFG